MQPVTLRNYNLWSIILAGGEGQRVGPLVQQWLGFHRPKQYCAFVGTRSLLQHTVARAARLAPGMPVLVIVDESHRKAAESQLRQGPAARVLLQPANRDTAAGIFLPLAYVRAFDPQATVVIYPSDHFVYPEEDYLAGVQRVVDSAEHVAGHIVLVGMAPESPDTDYGWIQPGPDLASNGCRVRSVLGFMEKPTHSAANAAMDLGALWNTAVIVAKASRLWELGWECFPSLMCYLDCFSAAIGSPDELSVLKWIYSVIPTLNFSTDLLQRIPQHLAVAEISGVIWSDWGKAERIASTLLKIRKEPKFPMKLLQTVGTEPVH